MIGPMLPTHDPRTNTPTQHAYAHADQHAGTDRHATRRHRPTHPRTRQRRRRCRCRCTCPSSTRGGASCATGRRTSRWSSTPRRACAWRQRPGGPRSKRRRTARACSSSMMREVDRRPSSRSTDRAPGARAVDRGPRRPARGHRRDRDRHQWTRIDLALLAAADELASARGRAEHLPVIVLMTDGHPTQTTPEAVRDAAAAARAPGTVVFVIGGGTRSQRRADDRRGRRRGEPLLPRRGRRGAGRASTREIARKHPVRAPPGRSLGCASASAGICRRCIA